MYGPQHVIVTLGCMVNSYCHKVSNNVVCLTMREFVISVGLSRCGFAACSAGQPPAGATNRQGSVRLHE